MKITRYAYMFGMLALALILGVWLSLIPLGPPNASAAPLSTGALNVNTSDDNNLSDGYLSLREAMLIIKGGTGAGGVNRHLKDSELARISGGCATVGGTIDDRTVSMSGCTTDTITFNLALGDNVIALNTVLPPIDWSAPTTIDGTGVSPVIDFSALGADTYGLVVYTNGHTIKNLGVKADATDGASPSAYANFYVAGNSNTFLNDWAWNGHGSGFVIIGSSNVISGSRIGVLASVSANCGTSTAFKGNAKYGIALFTNAQYNTFSNNYIGCNGSSAIYLDSSAGIYNTIGPNNIIGTNSYKSANLGNGGSGVDLRTGWNTVLTNTLAFGYHGMYVNTTNNLISGNAIISNTHYGIDLNGQAHENTIGCAAPNCTTGGANQISGNNDYGIGMFGTTVLNNDVYGNDVGASTRYVPAAGNFGGGILISGAISSTIGDIGVLSNSINSNLGAGIRIENGGRGNTVGSNTIDANLLDGVVIESSSHDNTIAGNRIGSIAHGNQVAGVRIAGNSYNNTLHGNDILSNGLSGVVIIGAGTYSNTLKINTIYGNDGDGITLASGTYWNTIGWTDTVYENYIESNGEQGIGFCSGAQYNTVGYNVIRLNTRNGIELADSSTVGNRISHVNIFDNGQGGINERNGANYNTWTNFSIYNNGGMGIDKSASNDTQN